MALRWLAMIGLAVAALSQPAAASEIDTATRRSILAHGPWPTPWSPDPSNRVSGNDAAIAFGQALFFDARLSVDGGRSCATCHRPDHGWAEAKATSIGLSPVDRNTPGLLDVRLHRWFGWDGGHDTLWGQSLRPLLDPREMGGSLATIARLVRDDGDLSCRYRQSFGASPTGSDEQIAVDAGKALAAFQESLTSPRAPFDDFRDALERGDEAAIDAYPAAARRGAALFVGRGNCDACHAGPGFTNREFHDVGIKFFKPTGGVDPGRFGGIATLQAGRYTLLGPFNDDPGRADGLLSRMVDRQHRNFGEFRVPGLRGAALTAPFMHNGSLPSLRAVVRHYSEIDEDRLHADGEQVLRRLDLREDEIDDLVAFLETLSAPIPAPLALPTCP